LEGVGSSWKELDGVGFVDVSPNKPLLVNVDAPMMYSLVRKPSN